MEDLILLEHQLLSEEKLVRDTVHRWVKEKALPLLPDAYEAARFPTELIPELASLGLLGMSLPEEYGGSEASYVSYGLACQELERGDSGLRSFVSVQSSLCMYCIYQHGNETQKQSFLPAMSRGEVIGCFGFNGA